MFTSTLTLRRLAGTAAALALSITAPVAGAGVDRGINVPPSKSRLAEPYSDALDRYLRNNTPVQTHSDALDRYLRNNRPVETHPDALGRFLANELRSRRVVIRPVDAEPRSNDGLSRTAAVIGVGLALALLGTIVTTRRLRVTLRNV